MSQVKRHLERYEELLNSINHYVEDELENDREQAEKLLSEIELSVNEHLPQPPYVESPEPSPPEPLPEHFEIVEMSSPHGSGYWIVARQKGRCPVFWQGSYESIEEAESDLPKQAQIQYPLELGLDEE